MHDESNADGDQDAQGASKQSKGGKARAERLTPEQRSEIARNAAAAKHKFPKATHSGVLRIGDVEFECAVLAGGVRVISESSFMESMGMYYSGWVARERRKLAASEPGESSAVLPLFASFKSLEPFIDNDLRHLLSSPVQYRSKDGRASKGVRAETIPKILNVWLMARDAALSKQASLPKRQAEIAQKADLLMRGLAQVGIIALVDEATGFQYDRPRRDLEKQLEKYLAEELRRWVRTFPADYFKQLCRLRGVELRPDMRLPQYFGKLTSNIVYRRIAPGLLKKLKERRAERGSQRNKLHSWLSEDHGQRTLLVHLGTVIGVMKMSKDYEEFEKKLDVVAPPYPEMPGLFDDPSEWEEPKA